MRRLALLLIALCALPGAARGGDLVESPYDCPPGTRGVKHHRKNAFVCRTRLDVRDVFMEDKNIKDPCPEGYWWKAEKSDPCTPIICTTEATTKGGFGCPGGMHAHHNAGADWYRPVECVYDYQPQNLKTGGRPFKEGECGRCTINTKFHWPPPNPRVSWQFLNPKRAERKRREAEKKKREAETAAKRLKNYKRRRTGFSSKLSKKRATEIGGVRKLKRCPAGKYSFRSGCKKCGPDTMTVRRKDGATFCIGGRAQACKEFGAPSPTNNAFQPYVCKACDPAKKRVVVNGWIRCLAHVCSGDKLPVPLEEKGLADCVVPLERLKDKPK